MSINDERRTINNVILYPTQRVSAKTEKNSCHMNVLNCQHIVIAGQCEDFVLEEMFSEIIHCWENCVLPHKESQL